MFSVNCKVYLNLFSLIIGGARQQMLYWFLVQSYFVLPLLYAYFFALDLIYKHEVEKFFFVVVMFIGISLALHVTCYFRDPGIIRKADQIEMKGSTNDESIQLDTEGTSLGIKDERNLKGDDHQVIMEYSVPTIFSERYCRTCKIVRPKLSSHCRVCNNCVMYFDQ